MATSVLPSLRAKSEAKVKGCHVFGRADTGPRGTYRLAQRMGLSVFRPRRRLPLFLWQLCNNQDL